MHTHCTSSALNRRDFLKLLITLSGLPYLLNGRSDAIVPMPSTWSDPIWIWALQNGCIRGPQQNIAHSDWIASVPYGLPGSIIKLVTATALLEEHLIQPNQILECRGSIRINGQRYACQQTHGKLTAREAIGYSCNVFFAQAVESLSARRFLHYARRFELHQPMMVGHPFQFDINGAARESIQRLALGLSSQIQPNALQLLRLAQRIAQRAIPDIKDETWELLQGGMRLAARQGTAHALDPFDTFKMAAKTGTTPHGDKFNAWLIGYFPFDAPRFAFCVRAVSGTARDSAVPLARHFLAQKEWS